MKNILFVVSLLLASNLIAASVADSLRFLEKSSDYVNLTIIDGLKFDVRYASTNNFTGLNLYGDYTEPYMHKIAADKLIKAKKILKEKYPDLSLLIFDALRPRSVQFLLWEHVKGTSQQKYVANPVRGSIHNFGFAVDLTLVDKNGNELDMGTVYDDFTPLAQPRLEKKFLDEGKLSKTQVQNRAILKEVMIEAGFIPLVIEWWHFDALPKNEVKSKYKIIE